MLRRPQRRIVASHYRSPIPGTPVTLRRNCSGWVDRKAAIIDGFASAIDPMR
jgi:hypothetical protein